MMSKEFKNLITRFAYITAGFVLGLFAYDQFASHNVDSFEYALRQHAIAVQNANISVTSFSTQSVDEEKKTNSLDTLMEEHAYLEQQQISLAALIEGLVETRVSLDALLVNDSLDEFIRADIVESISELNEEQQKYQATIDEQGIRIQLLEEEMDDVYTSLEDYIERAFEDIEDEF